MLTHLKEKENMQRQKDPEEPYAPVLKGGSEENLVPGERTSFGNEQPSTATKAFLGFVVILFLVTLGMTIATLVTANKNGYKL